MTKWTAPGRLVHLVTRFYVEVFRIINTVFHSCELTPLTVPLFGSASPVSTTTD